MNKNLKKLEIICFILLSFSVRASAPDWKALTVYSFPPEQPYKKLITAIGMIETKCDTFAFNPVEDATGFFQIRPIRLIDYNKRTGETLSRQDLFNYEISERIFLYYAHQIGPYKLDQIARNWNGSGQRTFAYWESVKRLL
jgi:hypothetical protein